MTVCDDGIWTAKGEDTWHVEGLKLRIHGYDTYIKATMDITYNGSEYVASGVRRVLGSEDALDTEDPARSSVEEWEPSNTMPFLTVPTELVAEERTASTTDDADDAEADAQPSAADLRQEWIDSQFSFWDGAHRDLEKLIKKSLNDEKSYKHIETKYTDVSDEATQAFVNQILESAGYSQRVEVGDLFISTEFSAKNLFNATVKKTAYGISSYANNTIELIDIE